MTDRASSPQFPFVAVPGIETLHGAAGTPPDFAAIFAGELGYVLRTLARLGVPSSDAEDLAHDVFVIVHRELVRFDAARPIRPWLFGIAFRVAADERRRARHRREVAMERPPEVSDPAALAEQHLIAAEERALVLEALAAVEIDRRAVLIMHDLDGHAMPVIARELGLGLNTAYSRLRLARDELRAAAQRLQRRRARP